MSIKFHQIQTVLSPWSLIHGLKILLHLCRSCLKSFNFVEALSDSDTRGGCPQTRSSKASGKDSQYHPSSKFQALHCSAQHYTYRPAHLSWPQRQEHPVPRSNACHTESKHLEDSKMQFVCVNQNANDEYLCWGCILSRWQIGSAKLSGSPFSMHFEAFWPIPSCMDFKMQHILMLQLSQNLHEISHSEDQKLSIWQWCPSQPARMCKIAQDWRNGQSIRNHRVLCISIYMVLTKF